MKRFTLIQLLVVVAFIGILASILLPSLVKARKTAMLAVSTSNLKQISTAVLGYSYKNNNGCFTPSVKGSRFDNYSWDGIVASQLGDQLTEGEKLSGKPPYRGTFEVLKCPLDNISRQTDYFTRSYQFNGYSAWGAPRMIGWDGKGKAV